MRVFSSLVVLLTSCAHWAALRQGGAPTPEPLVIGVAVTENSASPMVEAALVGALQRRGLQIGTSGDSVDYLLVLIAECSPAIPGSAACRDSVQLMFGLWSAMPLTERAESGYTPAGFRSEQAGVERVAPAAVQAWLEAFVDRIDSSCFDRVRLRRGLTSVRDGSRDYHDDDLWKCRLVVGRARVP